MNRFHKIINLIRKNKIGYALCAIFCALTMASCSMINEDLPGCAPAPRTYTIVNFEYTYNMKNEDWFNDHVGSVYLYVFDKDDTFLFRAGKSKTYMTVNDVDFSMVLDDTEIVPGNDYKLVAVAIGNHAGYQASLETPGFQVPEENVMIPGVSKLEDYRLKLDRDNDGIYDFGVVTDDYGVFNFKEAYKDNRLKLDTLWSTKPDCVQELRVPYIAYKPQIDTIPDRYNEVTIPMMRITNSVKINLVSDGFTQDFDVNKYNIIIDFPNGNGTIDFTGKTYPIKELMYLTLRKQMKQYQENSKGAQYNAETPETRADGVKYALNAEFGLSRMQVADGSFLEITDAETGEVIARIDNLSEWLADYFSDSHNYGDQEFLDREFDFTIDIQLNDTNDGIYSYQIGCSILGWGKRVYNYVLH